MPPTRTAPTPRPSASAADADPLPVVVVGAGPAGLATSARLREAGIDHVLLEREPRVAPAWHRHYDRLHLHTVKETSHLPFAPFGPDEPRYIPRLRLLEYFEDYARARELRPRLGVDVESVEREPGGNDGGAAPWVVRTAEGEVLRARHVVFATGFNRVPHRPSWPGEEEYGGEVLHSRDYRNGDPWRDRDVLVVGMGNTGAEIALDLLERGARPSLSIRGPVNIVPRDMLGRPTQKTALQLAKLPERIGDAIAVVLRKLTVGDLSRWGIETPAEPPAAQLRNSGKTPVIDVGTVAQIKKGRIRVRPGIDRFTPAGVRFEDGEEAPFAAVVLATGYRSRVEELCPAVAPLLDRHGNPPAGPAPPPCDGLHFVGFDGYAVGGLLRTIHRDSEIAVEAIGRALSPPAG